VPTSPKVKKSSFRGGMRASMGQAMRAPVLRYGTFERNGRFLRALVDAEGVGDATFEGDVKLWWISVKTTMMRT